VDERRVAAASAIGLALLDLAERLDGVEERLQKLSELLLDGA
jgi:hypothetical protein